MTLTPFLKSFRVRLALLSGLLALAVAGALSLYLGAMLSERALSERGDALRGLGHGVSVLLAEGLTERRREVTLLAGSREAQRIGLDPAAWRNEVERLKKARAHYAWIGVTDDRGIVISATGGLLVGQDVSSRDWFKGSLDRPYVGDVHPAKLLQKLLQPAGGEPLRFVDFAAPLRDASGRVIGVLGTHADWRWTREVIDLLGQDDVRNAGVQIYILDRQGRMIHDPAGEGSTTRPSSVAIPGPASALLDWTDHQRSLTLGVSLPSRSDLPDLGWTVIVRQPERLALRGVIEAQRAVWAAGALTAGLAMSLAWIMAGRFGRPLRDISEAAQRIEAGDRSGAIPVATHTLELERLSRALGSMTRHLLAREIALQQAGERLELRVAERTADLGRANEALALANADLDRVAHVDALTGLQNRRAADISLKKELAQHRRYGRTLGLLLCDIDHFKRINDTHGHACGDLVLSAVGRCIQECCRESDVAARFGGEEFLVILPETDATGAAAVGEKLRLAMAGLDVAGAGPIRLSIGAAMAELGRGSARSLLQRADVALYAAKAAGRDRLVVADPGQPVSADTTISELADLA